MSEDEFFYSEGPTTNRTAASDADFRARIRPIEDAPDAEEALTERVARAIFAAANPIVECWPDYWERVAGGEETRNRYRMQADAVIAVMRGRP